MFFGRSLPFTLDAPGGRASCLAPAREAPSWAEESVAFAALAFIFFSAFGVSAILFSGAVELQPPHFFRITSADLLNDHLCRITLERHVLCAPTRDHAFNGVPCRS